MSGASLPQGWGVATLGELGEWSGGGTPSKSNAAFWIGSIPWVSPKDMKRARIDDTIDHVNTDAVSQSAAKLVPANSVAFVVRSGILEHTLPVALLGVDTTLNQDLKALTPATAISPVWLLYAIQAQAPDIRTACQKDGTTVASIDFEKLKQRELLIPPRAEQDRIVGAVEAAMTAIDGGVQALEDAERIAAFVPGAVIDAVIWTGRGHPHDNVSGWPARLSDERRQPWNERQAAGLTRRKYAKAAEPNSTGADRLRWPLVSLDQACEFVTDGDHNPPKRTPTGVPHLTAKHVKGGELLPDGATCISEQDYERVRKRYEPRAGDLIVTCVGTIGRTAVVSQGFRFSPDRNLAGLRLLPSVHPNYIELALNGFRLQRMMSTASGSTAQPHLYLGDLRSLSIPLPPPEVQAALVSKMRQRLDGQRDLDESTATVRDRATDLRRSILHQAFTGQLVSQDPADEPASVLLERIKAEKSEREEQMKQEKSEARAAKKRKKAAKKPTKTPSASA